MCGAEGNRRAIRPPVRHSRGPIVGAVWKPGISAGFRASERPSSRVRLAEPRPSRSQRRYSIPSGREHRGSTRTSRLDNPLRPIPPVKVGELVRIRAISHELPDHHRARASVIRPSSRDGADPQICEKRPKSQRLPIPHGGGRRCARGGEGGGHIPISCRAGEAVWLSIVAPDDPWEQHRRP